MARQIQLRSGTAAEWTASNPVLLDGELGINKDSNTYKVGDGVTPWNSLAAGALSPELSAMLLQGVGAEPSAPEANKLLLYAKDIGGRMMTKMVGPSGLDTVLQPAFFNNSIAMMMPGGTTALTAIGMALTTQTGTVAHPAIVSGGTLMNTMRRATLTSAATAGSVSYMRGTIHLCQRGPALKATGFFFSTRFGVSQAPADSHLQVGLFNSTSLTAGTFPSAQTLWVGVGWDPTDGNLMAMCNGPTGTATKINLGAGFPKNNVDAVYELVMFAKVGGTTISFRVNRLDVPAVYEGEFPSGNIPGDGVLLAYHSKLCNNATASAVVYNFMRMYLETDY